jgi:hypothetical protein
MKGQLIMPESERTRIAIHKLLTGEKVPPSAYICKDCNTVFEVKFDGFTRCNGEIIRFCPWCREDSKPWRNGRGV